MKLLAHVDIRLPAVEPDDVELHQLVALLQRQGMVLCRKALRIVFSELPQIIAVGDCGERLLGQG